MSANAFQIAEVAQLRINESELRAEVETLKTRLAERSDQVSNLRLDITIVKQQAEEDKKNTVEMLKAEHMDQMNRDRKAHFAMADHLVQKYVEKELRAIKAINQMNYFRADREQRRKEIAIRFRCGDVEDQNALKRRQPSNENEDGQMKRRKISANDHVNQSIEARNWKIHEEMQRRRFNEVPQNRPKPVREPNMEEYYRKQYETDAHVEADIPFFGEEHADFREEDLFRAFDRSQEVLNKENMSVVVFVPEDKTWRIPAKMNNYLFHNF